MVRRNKLHQLFLTTAVSLASLAGCHEHRKEIIVQPPPEPEPPIEIPSPEPPADNNSPDNIDCYATLEELAADPRLYDKWCVETEAIPVTNLIYLKGLDLTNKIATFEEMRVGIKSFAYDDVPLDTLPERLREDILSGDEILLGGGSYISRGQAFPFYVIEEELEHAVLIYYTEDQFNGWDVEQNGDIDDEGFGIVRNQDGTVFMTYDLHEPPEFPSIVEFTNALDNELSDGDEESVRLVGIFREMALGLRYITIEGTKYKIFE